MKPVHKLALCLLAVPLTLALRSAASAAPVPGSARAAATADEGEEHSPLAEAMEGLQEGMRALRKLSKGTEDQAACLEVLHALQESTLAALACDPVVPEGQEPPAGDALAVWKVSFKRQIVKLADKLYELEIAVHEGRFDALAPGFSALSEIKNDGHNDYQ